MIADDAVLFFKFSNLPIGKNYVRQVTESITAAYESVPAILNLIGMPKYVSDCIRNINPILFDVQENGSVIYVCSYIYSSYSDTKHIFIKKNNAGKYGLAEGGYADVFYLINDETQLPVFSKSFDSDIRGGLRYQKRNGVITLRDTTTPVWEVLLEYDMLTGEGKIHDIKRPEQASVINKIIQNETSMKALIVKDNDTEEFMLITN